jgi:hypothetical protein
VNLRVVGLPSHTSTYLTALFLERLLMWSNSVLVPVGPERWSVLYGPAPPQPTFFSRDRLRWLHCGIIRGQSVAHLIGLARSAAVQARLGSGHRSKPSQHGLTIPPIAAAKQQGRQ